VSTFAYHRPESVDAFRRVLAESSGPIELLAGGTDVLVGLAKGTRAPDVVVDLKHLDVLRPTIDELDGRLSVGALNVMTELIADPRARYHFQALVEAAEVVGSVQIRNRATLVGNVCNASPAADTVPALLVYGATVNVVGAEGERIVPLADFFTGPGTTVLERGELVTSIELPVPLEVTSASFLRVTRRRGFDLGTVSVACLVAAGAPTRFAFGAVASRPVLAIDRSGVLGAEPADPGEEGLALERLLAVTSPISDIRGSAEYRSAMLLTLSRRALERARGRLASAVSGAVE
jgi:CO/xanthine dehydrogenase FAD-binding subunit